MKKQVTCGDYGGSTRSRCGKQNRCDWKALAAAYSAMTATANYQSTGSNNNCYDTSKRQLPWHQPTVQQDNHGKSKQRLQH